jgi:PPOX class probable F420-dependent enzyme
MRPEQCWARLRETSHGVLSTMHPERGVDAVPVVFAVVDDGLVVPVDRVKHKRSTDLRRVRNIAGDPRCVFLADHYEDDWTRLWWVRVHARAETLVDDDAETGRRALAARFAPYRTRDAIAAVLLLRPTLVRGWAAR